MAGQARIVQDPNILGGKPIIEGTRLAVWLIQEQVANGFSEDDLLKSYPRLTTEGIKAALLYADEHGMVPFEDWDKEVCPRCPQTADKDSSLAPWEK